LDFWFENKPSGNPEQHHLTRRLHNNDEKNKRRFKQKLKTEMMQTSGWLGLRVTRLVIFYLASF
jgi:hypothetical protein